MKRLLLTEIARADLDSIRRYSARTWGEERTTAYMSTLRDTLKGLLRGTATARGRDDLYDIRKIAEAAQARQAESGRKTVRLPPRKPKAARKAS